MAEDSGRISVSRDALRAELATLELNLIKTLATKDEVEALRKEHAALELRVVDLEREDRDDRAVREHADELFSRREKRIGLCLAIVALMLQVLILTGVLR